MYCKKCGAQIDDDAYVCVHCGALVKEMPQETAFAQNSAVQTGKKTNAMAIAGFVCSFLFAILGLIFSIIGMKQCEERGEDGYELAKAGKIISIVNIALSIFIIIIYAIAVAVVIPFIKKA